MQVVEEKIPNSTKELMEQIDKTGGALIELPYSDDPLAKLVGKKTRVRDREGNKYMPITRNIDIGIEKVIENGETFYDYYIPIDIKKAERTNEICDFGVLDEKYSGVRDIRYPFIDKKFFHPLDKRIDGDYYIMRNQINAAKQNWKILRKYYDSYNPENEVIKSDLYKDIPIIICGAGPSLKNDYEIINRLLERKSKVIVMAINGAIRLVKKPTYFFTADWKGDSKWFDDVDTKDLTAIVAAFSAPVVLNREWGKLNLFLIEEEHKGTYLFNKIFKGLPKLQLTLASIISATHLAYIWGCNPIIYTGCDGTTQIGYHHYEHQISKDENIINETENIYAAINRKLEGLCEYVGSDGRKIYNCSCTSVFGIEPNVYTDKIEWIPLQKALRRYFLGD